MTRIFHIAFLICVTSVLYGQDYIYSQYINTPLMVNPALTGDMNTDYRAGLGYRTQWASIAEPFLNTSAYYDMSLLKQRSNKNQLGVGAWISRDQMGKAKMGLLQAVASVAYRVSMNDYNTFSTGMQIGYVQRSIDFAGLAWDSQYNGVGFDPSLDHKEAFSAEKQSSVDASAGLLWRHTKKAHYALGYSMWHYGQQQSFLAGGSDKLFVRHVLHGEYEFKEKFFDVLVRAKSEIQSGAIETTVGLHGRYRTGLDSRYTDFQTSSAITAGVYYRVGDAITPMLGYEFQRMVQAWFSYDINISRLNVATNYRGGWEIHLMHTGMLTTTRRKLR